MGAMINGISSAGSDDGGLRGQIRRKPLYAVKAGAPFERHGLPALVFALLRVLRQPALFAGAVVKLPVFLKGQVNAVYSLADEDVFANGVSAVRRKLHDVEVGAGFALRRIDMDAALPGARSLFAKATAARAA